MDALMAKFVWVCAYSITIDKWRVQKVESAFADCHGLPSYASFDDARSALEKALAHG